MPSPENANSDNGDGKIKIRSRKSNELSFRVKKMLSLDKTPVDEGNYKLTKDLEPLKNPEKQVKIIFRDLNSGDWQKQFEA